MQKMYQRPKTNPTSYFKDMNPYLELETLAEEFEILLSNDFANMSLDELKRVEASLNKIAGMRDDRETVRFTESQRQSRDYLWFRIKQEENKDDSVKIGDVFCSSWGYEQTNVEMFKVVGFTKSKKSAIIRQIGMETKKDSEGFMSDSVLACPDIELKSRIWDEENKCYKFTEEHKPDLRVKIERSTEWNPRTHKREQIGSVQLRGSVYFSIDENKHLQTLTRLKEGKSHYRSWYA